jgi:hypothetical protein
VPDAAGLAKRNYAQWRSSEFDNNEQVKTPAGKRRFLVSKTSTENKNHQSVALDAFRGLAAILMVFNHAGHAWLSAFDADNGWQGGIVFLGSFAPVLFFFATGVGIGLTPGRLRTAGGAMGLAWKCVLLILADQLLFLRTGSLWGLDFFGFIALSMIIVGLVDRLQRAVPTAILLIAVMLVFRYAIALMLPAAWAGHPVAAIFFGSMPNVSYPVSPWLVYPLVGYVMARSGFYGPVAKDVEVPTKRFRPRVALIACSVVALGTSLLFLQMGKGFFRWGTVSLGFFIASCAVIPLFILASEAAAAKLTKFSSFISLRGAAALLVVPTHYALIHLALQVSPGAWSPGSFFVGSTLAVIVALVVSKVGARFAASIQPRIQPGMVFVLIGLVIVTAARFDEITTFASATAAQILIGLVLGLRDKKKQSPLRPAGQ